MPKNVLELLTKPSSGEYSTVPPVLSITRELEEFLLEDFVENLKEITTLYISRQGDVYLDILLRETNPLQSLPSHIYPAVEGCDKLVRLYNKGYRSFDSLLMNLSSYSLEISPDEMVYYQAEEAVSFVFEGLLLKKIGLDNADALVDLGHIKFHNNNPSAVRDYLKNISNEFIAIGETSEDFKENKFCEQMKETLDFGNVEFKVIKERLRNFHNDFTWD